MNNVKTFPLLENIRNAFLREIQSTEKYDPNQGKKYGKSLRKTISRTQQGQWTFRAHRTDKIQLIFDQERNRVQDIIPLRHERMKASPFAFLRGAAIVMASDMSELTSTNIRVQACGDAHIANFGIFASPERHLVFDINDFDETLPAPWEWDIKRMVASMEVCGRDRGFTPELRSQAIQLAIKTYQDSMHQYASMSPLAVWYDHVDMETLQTSSLDLISNDVLQKTMNKALQKNQEKAIEKLTEFVDGHYRFKEDPPEILPIRTIFEQKNMSITPEQLSKQLELMMKTYRLSLPKERRFIIDQYTIRDIAFKVVGVGSVGTRCWVILLEGGSNQDTLILQIKEANESVLEPYAGASIFHEHGRRVVEGLRAAQTAGDILTGWVSIPQGEGKWLDYYVRQLWDYKGSFNLTKIEANDFVGYCALCARTLAHAHAKTGNRFAIAGYLGNNDRFCQSMVQFAQAYANQNEDDYQTFLQALK